MDEKAYQELVRARVRLMRFQPFFGYLVMHLQPEEVNEIPTAGTDGVKLYYNPESVNRWAKEDVLCGVLCHEVLHPAFGHLWRKEGKVQLPWNAACDLAINPHIIDTGLKLPEGCLNNPEYSGLSAEQIYTKLKITTISGGDSFCAGVLDPAKSDEGGVKGKAEDKEGDKEGQGAGSGDKEGDNQGQGDKISDQIDGNSQQTWKRRLVQAAEVAKIQGNLPASLERLVAEEINPTLPWQDILRNLINSLAKADYRTFPPNKRHLWRGIYLPSVRSEGIEFVVALDNSGSISDGELASFAAEVRGMTEALGEYTIHLLVCDAKVNGEWELTPFSGEIPRRFYGGGGTDFRPVFDWIGEKQIHPACLVYFTDAYGRFPDIEPANYPVIWVLTENHSTVPWGYKIETNFSSRRLARRR